MSALSLMTDDAPRRGFSLKGTAGLLIAVAAVAAVLIAWPAYRVFFLISVAIGVAVAGGLFLWHKLRPIRDEDVENKKPLGLS
jgi:asparagine N-glycosylation enzyme membrane subunit Stt3